MKLTDTEAVLLGDVRAELEQLVLSRTQSDPEDVVQESLARLLEVRARLDAEVWKPYALATARHLLHDRARQLDKAARHQHRLFERPEIDSPEAGVLRAEEHAAVQRGLDALDAPERELLNEHYSGDQGVLPGGVTPARAARLARVRARLRLAYVLQHERVQLPTSRCRPVLEALSAGERRRQVQLGTSRHLTACSTCAVLAPALVHRRRSLVGWQPLSWAGLTGAAAAVWAAMRRRPARSSVAVGGAVVVAGTVMLASQAMAPTTPVTAPPSSAPPAAAPPVGGTLQVDGLPVSLGPDAEPLQGGTATGQDLSVVAVPADEGFWVGAPEARIWVQLVTNGGESVRQVRPGDLVSLRGVVRRTDEQFPARVGLTQEEGAGEVLRRGLYVEVLVGDLDVRPG